MQRIQVEDLYRELAATDISFVRYKLIHGGYNGWRQQYVEMWLQERDRAEDRRYKGQILHWTIFAAVIGAGALAIALTPSLVDGQQKITRSPSDVTTCQRGN